MVFFFRVEDSRGEDSRGEDRRGASVVKMVSVSDLDEQISRLKRCEYLKESEVKALCDKAREILIDESNVQPVDAPVTVC